MTAPTTVFALWGRSRDFSTWTVAVNRPFTFAYLARWQRRVVECPRCGASAAAPYLTSATACHTGGATRRGSNLSDCHEERVQAWKAKHA